MTKTFKKFRESWDDDWSDEDDRRSKDQKMRDRRENRRKKTNEKLSRFDESDDE